MLLHFPGVRRRQRRGVSRSMRFQAEKKLSAAGDSETITLALAAFNSPTICGVIDPVAVFLLVSEIRRIDVDQCFGAVW